MRLGIRSKLFLISVALIISAGLAGGLYLERELRQTLEARMETELRHQANAARETVQTIEQAFTIERIDPFADRLSVALQSRVTIIDPEGRVLGDSKLTPAEVAAIDNHSDRPEVIAALAHGHGQSQRFSTTLDVTMLYVAAPYHRRGAVGVVRVARPLSEITAAIARLRTLLLASGLLLLLVAVVMSGLASHFMSRTLRRLAETARAISSESVGHGERARLNVESRDELGGLAGSLNRISDDIAQTVSALAIERARFEAVLEGMNEAVIALDGDHRVTLMNSAALNLLGLDEVPLGTPLIEHVRVPALLELLGEPTSSGSAEFDLFGEPPRRVLARLWPEQRESGCVLVMHDVTSIRRLETVRRDFVANVSHELRTPVSIIRANAETLLDGAMEDPVHGHRLLDALHRNAERLSRIIEDLLNLSRLEASRYQSEREQIALANAVKQALDAVERAAQAKKISLTADVDDELTLHCDANALDQILINYLDNALKYTPEGGRVQVDTQADDERVRISVTDNGPGITASHRERIFERFYRVDPGRSRDMGGTGLGLSIVKHLADAMDGEAGMDPVEPHGSRFWIALPRA